MSLCFFFFTILRPPILSARIESSAVAPLSPRCRLLHDTSGALLTEGISVDGAIQGAPKWRKNR